AEAQGLLRHRFDFVCTGRILDYHGQYRQSRRIIARHTVVCGSICIDFVHYLSFVDQGVPKYLESIVWKRKSSRQTEKDVGRSGSRGRSKRVETLQRLYMIENLSASFKKGNCSLALSRSLGWSVNVYRSSSSGL